VNLLHPASAGAPVALWFVAGSPVRLVHGTTRYRVTRAQQWSDCSGWTITARSATGQVGQFAVRATTYGWQLNSAE
jgi:hypothetical protein